MAALSWYWHRLRAMEPGEAPRHFFRKLQGLRDAIVAPDWSAYQPGAPTSFPSLPKPAETPESLRAGIARDADNILAGRWRILGGLDLKVDDPPRWQKDYLADKDVWTDRPASKLNHRELPAGADVRVIWELSRWNELMRLGQAAYLLDHEKSAGKCVEWLKDWVSQNPPFRRWNWTSALEAGLRLIHFAWIDALLRGSKYGQPFSADLDWLSEKILSPHVRFTWQGRSFGSSANNHLLGELAGLITAIARWPALEKAAASLERLQANWEAEVLKQFAEDGGNREQALNYHLFAWELCWQARLALHGDGRKISGAVEERLARAAEFYCAVQAPNEPWDYGDSDGSRVLPLYSEESAALEEWRNWIRRDSRKARNAGKDAGAPSYEFWPGDGPAFTPEALYEVAAEDWRIYRHSGVAVAEPGFWWLRWDVSPLGYLKPAAHGHMDAQHLSIWFRGVAMVIDPGTGAYYSDPPLRSWLSSGAAHNGPFSPEEEGPQRRGPFLWSSHHPIPTLKFESKTATASQLMLSRYRIARRIARTEAGDGWQVSDSVGTLEGRGIDFVVRWQFPPQTVVKVLAERRFQLNGGGVSIIVEADEHWDEALLVEHQDERPAGSDRHEGIVAPSFRRVQFAPYLTLKARAGQRGSAFSTTFLAG